jgi:hypothetical protein
MFLSSFYCYLKYHSTNDFIIDLDNVWHWLGFSQKVNAKILLEKQFKLDTDYKKSLLLQQKQTNVKGGHNKEIFMLNITPFYIIIKSLVLRSVIRDFNETEKVVHSMHTLGGS